jgi:anti-sigma B factor antagonist
MATSRSRLNIDNVKDVTVVGFTANAILDTLHIQQMGDELYELVDKQSRRKIVLDFAEVKFLSSQALGVLLTMRRKADQVKGTVVIAGLRKELQKVFTITNLEKLFTFYPDKDAALSDFGITAI